MEICFGNTWNVVAIIDQPLIRNKKEKAKITVVAVRYPPLRKQKKEKRKK